ncbi:hemicentin-1 isoform X2 [Pocillopora verrucosa]|uniref:hemicentin-1 isoform X2 n=1 Tax=Pocillopora verrucosa TaxID=203993 RepID=UPI003341B89D
MAVAKSVRFCMLQNMYRCVFIWLSLTALFSSVSAIHWNKTPPAIVKGILGENVTLEWNFTISSANETLDYFSLLRSSYLDMIKYSHSTGKVIYEDFKGRVDMLVDGSPKFVLLSLQREDDKAEFCLKVLTKSITNTDGKVHWPKPHRCAKIKLLERPGIVGIPKNHTVTFIEREDVKINCRTTGIPIPNVTWTRSGNEAKNFPPASPLILKNISREEDGLYWCVAENGLGKVTASVRVIVKFPPSIKYITPNTTVNETDDVTLFCNSTGNPAPNITWVLLDDLDAGIRGTQESLTFSHVKRNQSGTYGCFADNGVMGRRNDSVHITINYSPTIDIRPISQAVNKSNNLELFCNATGHPTPQITWYKLADPSELLTVGTVLNVMNMNRTDSGVYQCRASNGIGIDAFASANVTVNIPPSFDYISNDTIVNETDDVMLFCNSTGHPHPHITWRFLSESEKPLGYEESLTLSNVNRTQTGTYLCTASNNVTNSKTASIQVTVNYSPSIVMRPISKTVNESNNLELFCNATGHPTPLITWYKVADPSVPPSVGTVLNVTNMSRTDSGVYQCRASNGIGTDVFALANVTVNYAPKIDMRPLSQTVNESDNLELFCNATGRPAPQIMWYKVADTLVPLSNDTALKVKNINRTGSGVYRCRASNGIGTGVCASATVTVNFPPSLDYTSDDTTINETDNVTLFCNATGYPHPRITWTFLRGSESTIVGREESLPLSNVSRTQAGTYQCTAFNDWTSSEAANIQVIVNYAPKIDMRPVSQTVNESDNLELFCNATGHPAPQITWYKLADPLVPLSNDTALKVKNINRTDSGVYRCRASNGIGTGVCASANVTVNFPPSLDYTSDETTVNETDNVTLFCNATGYPYPRITWTFLRGSESAIVGREEYIPLSNVSRTQAGTYQCTASNDWTSSKAANVQVTVNYRPFATRLTSNATRNTAISGLPVTFLCNSDSVPPPALELRFKNKSLGLFSGRMFTIEHVNASDEGMYQCVPNNILGTGKIATLYLTVAVPPSFEYISNDTTVKENDNIVLFCNSTGHPPPRITWTILSGSKARIVGHEEYLNLLNVSRTQAGTYQCTASNNVTSSKTTKVQVTINYKPEIKDTVQTTIYTWINRETKLTCAVDGVPRPNITFTRAGSVLHSTPSEDGASQLRIKPEGAADFGDYTCTAKNYLGSVQKIIKIKQLVAPAAPEGLEIETGLHNMEVRWQALESTPDSPVEDYLVIVEMRGESESRKTCIRVHTGKRDLTCAVNDLESGTVYSVKVAARNKVGYSEFAEKEVQTETEAKPITNTVKKEFQEQHQQEHLSNTVIDGIIAGVLIFCSLVVVIFAILKHRRPCHPVCKKERQDLSSEECNEGHDNPGCSSENPVADQMEERV